MHRWSWAVLATVIVLGAASSSSHRVDRVSSTNPFPGCAPPPAPGQPVGVAVGVVACQELTTHLLGNAVAAPFEYYVPPVCSAPGAGRCPVLYLLHGFGGSYNEMLGQPGTTSSAWIAAETSAPPAGFESAPWDFDNPSTWAPAPSLGMVLVAPLGQTLPGGYGPGPGLDSYWVDWNPRYAKGGDSQRYDTPPPRFESYIVDELVPFVEANLPAGTGRQFRAIAGVSLGGYGAYKLGLQHPDEWTTMMSVSGAHNFLFAPAPEPGEVTLPAGVAPPVPVTYTPLPPPTAAVPTAGAPSQVGTFTTAITAFGDPAADQAYFRGNMPTDLAMNGRAFDHQVSSLGIDGFVNDMIPMQTLSGDSAAAGNDVSSEPFENIVFPMNVDMESAFAEEGVANTFAVHQGNHSDVYRNAWFRGLEEFAYGRLRHADGGGAPPPAPTTFDYRSISTDFSIWGWHIQVDRTPVEFLTMRSVTCSGLTLQGTGVVTVTVPAACHSGSGRSPTVVVDLGPSQATSDPSGLGATPLYGRTVTVALSPLA
ncbi:MAG TPA: alpha/beta hydrolase-fold protein [Acidimicrobiales bacterium]|nr:alpha/beta hydrolase-fold protein [Acidimicrobiales bacterium]